MNILLKMTISLALALTWATSEEQGFEEESFEEPGFVDWESLEPLTVQEREIKDILFTAEIALKDALKNGEQQRYSNPQAIKQKTLHEMEKVGKMIIDDQRKEIRAEFAVTVSVKFQLLEDLIMGTMNSDGTITRAPREPDFFDSQTDLERQFLIEWRRLRPFSPRETIIHDTLMDSVASLMFTLATSPDASTATQVLKKSEKQISFIAELIDSSSEAEVRAEFSEVVQKKFRQMRDLMQRISTDLSLDNRSLEQGREIDEMERNYHFDVNEEL